MSADKRKPHGPERRSAKELLKLVRKSDASATERAKKFVRDFDPSRFSLMTAQHVVACEAGFRSWGDMLHSSLEPGR